MNRGGRIIEIKLLTTEKKLTKSLLKQMRTPSKKGMEKGEVLGYINGVIKDNYKAILIHYKEDYFVISGYYRKNESSVSRKIGRWTQTKTFKTPELCTEW